MPSITPLLSVAQIRQAEKQAVELGVTSFEQMMERAGVAVVEAIVERYTPCPVIVLCGPGNNGGDGFVVARFLSEMEGWDVSVAFLGDMASLNPEGAAHAKLWKGEVLPCNPSVLEGKELAVDALFGMGLSRPLDDGAHDMVASLALSGIPTVAVDIPSGIHGDTGEKLGVAAHAELTVTFAAKKYAHLLQPGRDFCGEVIVADIGIPGEVIESLGANVHENLLPLWQSDIPITSTNDHKYTRGHTLVMGGPAYMTGAARLAAYAALRNGSGLVSIACTEAALPIYAASVTSIMLSPYETLEDIKKILSDKRKNTVLVGPGNGVTPATLDNTLASLASGKSCVVDADAISVFKEDPTLLFEAIKASGYPVVLTPHEGEFARLFTLTGSKLERAREAARISNATIILKGPDTVIAHPDGRAAINSNGVACLATAGSGDILAGMLTGLLANHVEPFSAACMAVWMHAEAAARVGTGMISEDLQGQIPAVWQQLYELA
ncbi:MAG: Carbohydrate kinase [Rickettsiales bacterium]|jgi:NAD(P)H-hydrate epimerase|nr:Carbohydrate kinase [Rickettsiales bacterium]